ncbi:hypothetical protein [Alkaliphilus crotonatoxidans]
MKRKIIALLAFIATGCGLLISAVMINRDILTALLAGIVIIFYGLGLLGHYREITHQPREEAK